MQLLWCYRSFITGYIDGLRDEIEEGWRQLMEVGLGGLGIVKHGYLGNKGAREVAAVKNCGICSRDTSIQTFYSRREDGGSSMLLGWWDQDHGLNKTGSGVD